MSTMCRLVVTLGQMGQPLTLRCLSSSRCRLSRLLLLSLSSVRLAVPSQPPSSSSTPQALCPLACPLCPSIVNLRRGQIPTPLRVLDWRLAVTHLAVVLHIARGICD